MRFKHLVLLVLAAMSLVACSNQESVKWEYMILPVEGSKLPTVYLSHEVETLIQRSDFNALDFHEMTGFSETLNAYGKERWELVNVYTTTETVFPNFGDAQYHTGVKENTRTQTINFVFKRQITQTGTNRQ